MATNIRKIENNFSPSEKFLLLFSTNTPNPSCGIQEKSKTIEVRIASGDKADLGSWPWAAALGTLSNKNEMQVVCGGTLIKENYVLTAAHCFHAGNGNPSIVRLGDVDISKNTDGAIHEDISIQRAIVHPR